MTEFKVHPLYVYKYLKFLLPLLVLPFFKGYSALKIILVCFAVAVCFAYVVLYKISLLKDAVLIKSGIIFRKTAVIPTENISSITISDNFIYKISGAKGISINTESGAYGKKDFEFKLFKADADILYLRLCGEKPVFVKQSGITLLSATGSSALTGLLIGVPFINGAGKLFNLGIEQILGGISRFGRQIKTYFPPAVNIITLIFLLFYTVSFVYALLRNAFFSMGTKKEKIEIISGLLVKKTRIIRKTAVKDLCIDTTPIMRLFSLCTLRAAVGGYGGEKGEKATVIPAANLKTVKETIFSLFNIKIIGEDMISPAKNSKSVRRFLILPLLYAILTVGIGGALIIIFRSFKGFFMFFFIVLLCFDLYYGFVSLREQRESGIGIGKTFFIRCRAKFTAREMITKSENIGVIKITRNRFDRKYGTCKVKITVRSESSDKAMIKNIPFEPIKEKIEEVFNIMV